MFKLQMHHRTQLSEANNHEYEYRCIGSTVFFSTVVTYLRHNMSKL